MIKDTNKNISLTIKLQLTYLALQQFCFGMHIFEQFQILYDAFFYS